MTDIEQLKKEANEVEKWLEELKNNVSISESEKKTKAEELKTKAESTKHKIESEIASLSEKTETEPLSGRWRITEKPYPSLSVFPSAKNPPS